MSKLVLNETGLQNKADWESAGYQLPSFDRAKVMEETKKNPQWIHFGAGNIFRAFQANVCQKMIENGDMSTGLVVAEGFDYEIIEKSYRPQDNYSVLVTILNAFKCKVDKSYCGFQEINVIISISISRKKRYWHREVK